jgi:hypothetical protein
MGKNEDAGVLGGDGEFGCESDDDETPRGRRLHIAIEGKDGGEHEAGKTNVGADDRAVSEEIRIEDQQGEGNEGGTDAEHFLSGEKNEESKQEGEKPAIRARKSMVSASFLKRKSLPPRNASCLKLRS